MSSDARQSVPEPETGHVTDAGKLIPRCGHIVIRPAIPEWEERAEDYEELITALSDRGIDVEVAEVKGIPSGADLPAFIPVAFAVYIGVKATDALIGSIVDELMRRVVGRATVRWWRKGEKVKGVLYGPDGEVLREIVFESRGAVRNLIGGDRLLAVKRVGGGICAVAIFLAITGCGGSGSSDTGSEATDAPAPTTSAVEVQQLVQLFRDNRKQAEEDAATRDECGDVAPIEDYSRKCAKPWAELVAARLSETEAIVNELKTRVGKGCREALSGGNPYIPLDTKKISGCSADVGRS